MKELSIEQKAKAYDVAIEKIQKYVKDDYGCTRLRPEDIFPELKESEDEKIKDAAIEFVRQNKSFNYCLGISKEDVITWLEKQGEQKPAVIIPKFRIGDEIKTTNEEPLTITKIDEKGYWSEDLFICGFDNAAKWELVEQKPSEWSEEDEKILTSIIFPLAVFMGNEDKIDWLKSLKDRYTWKPSDEQMEAIAEALSLAKNCGEEWSFDLRTLYEQLKKLR